jgi:predicted nucleic acid-binding protein
MRSPRFLVGACDVSDPRIEINVREFAAISAIDTCSICNVVSSPRLLAAARAKNAWFIVAGYVRYEALVRQRSNPTDGDLSIQREFRERLDQKRGFSAESPSVDDLLAIANLLGTRRLGRGEIAAMALARKMRIAFMTDDQKARRSAGEVGIETVQTTPHLLGWLVYCGALSDSDVVAVISEHETRVAVNRARLSEFLNAAYYEACRCRLLQNRSASGGETIAAVC